MATCNEKDIELLERFRKLAQGPGFIVTLAGNSPREFEYKKAVLLDIIGETNGESLKPIEDAQIQGAILWRFIRMTTAIREAH